MLIAAVLTGVLAAILHGCYLCGGLGYVVRDVDGAEAEIPCPNPRCQPR